MPALLKLVSFSLSDSESNAYQEAQVLKDELEKALRAVERGRFALVKAGDNASRYDLSLQLERATEFAKLSIDETLECYDRLFQSAPHWKKLQSEIADLYWRLLCFAEKTERPSARYLAGLKRYDDGRYIDLIEGSATLEIESDPQGAQIHLTSSDGITQILGQTPLAPIDLAPGNYQIKLKKNGFLLAKKTINLERGSDLHLDIRLYHLREIGEGFHYIAAGRFHDFYLDSYAISNKPLSLADYREFIDDLANRDPERALALIASDEEFSTEQARAYCHWLSQKINRRVSLPSILHKRKAKELFTLPDDILLAEQNRSALVLLMIDLEEGSQAETIYKAKVQQLEKESRHITHQDSHQALKHISCMAALLHAERAILVHLNQDGGEDYIELACSAIGHPLPQGDQIYDRQLACSAVEYQSLEISTDRRQLAIAYGAESRVVIFSRRFSREKFNEREEILASSFSCIF